MWVAIFVIPGSQRLKLHEKDMRHTEWLALVKRYFEENRERVSAPPEKKPLRSVAPNGSGCPIT